MIYDKINKFVLEKNHLVGEYRQLGIDIREHRRENPHNSHLSKKSIGFIVESEKDSGFKAYWSVQAQYNLINTHVFGENPYSESAMDACSEIGRIFQWIKAADNIVDSIGDPVQQADMLLEIQYKINSSRYDSVAEQFLCEEYNIFSDNTKDIIQTVYDTEISRILASSDTERMKFRAENGDILGHLEYDLMNEHGLKIPEHADSFLRYQGRAGAFFDDFKDFKLDRENGEGYEQDIRLKLIAKGISNFTKSLKILSKEERKRHMSFLLLGGMYQLRELIGIQERT